VHFRADEPYIFTSGLASPVYIDCRKLISYPRIRSTLMDFAVATLTRDVGFEAFDAIAGGETAGIPFAAWIAERMQLPMQYVRKKPKALIRLGCNCITWPLGGTCLPNLACKVILTSRRTNRLRIF